ncbi:hypothetical protein A1O1_01006 [Capronia coronata CBS 617.96]|uniref:Uncharacterized protein n=1 Tax=Capronia coronata CBS 617.96 TaxID=1182541 RepID=W9Z2V0_9EURO|nr:uncharacterized protein A1O1_01006 [Capronia coronata CBS 617.96]EXJ95881.1 hypothetical protein A1O1_01006 [Capronia coronata CBS 617.96]
MSADLYAAFGAAAPIESKTPNNISAKVDNKTTSSVPLAGVQTQSLPSLNQVWNTPHRESQEKVPPPLWRRDLNGNDVLFDAEAPEADDFGEFETVNDGNEGEVSADTNRHDHSQILVPDLLGDDDPVPQAPITSFKLTSSEIGQTPLVEQRGEEAFQPSWDDDWGDFQQTGTEQAMDPEGSRSRALQDSVAVIPVDGWEPFEDGPSTKNQISSAPKIAISSTGLVNTATSQGAAPAPVFERPTNIPPPSSLLQLLSTVFQTIHSWNGNQSKMKSELASQVMVVFRTACRLVAGRTLRWKRDTILAQSVRVGQAGKTGGMKLASLNKNESAKELRDSEEMIHDWSQYTHEFKSILAQAHLPPHRIKIPASPSIQILKYSSTQESTKQCALCGLKRTERLAEVDTDIDDIFGEFWTEHWGHKDCYDFWYTYKDLLSHR